MPAVKPTKPDKPKEPVKADPGARREVEGKEPEQHQPDETKTGWIEIALIGEDGEPIPGAWYEVTLPDGTLACGALDEEGEARIEGFEPGDCEICFPDLDEEAWEPA